MGPGVQDGHGIRARLREGGRPAAGGTGSDGNWGSDSWIRRPARSGIAGGGGFHTCGGDSYRELERRSVSRRTGSDWNDCSREECGPGGDKGEPGRKDFRYRKRGNRIQRRRGVRFGEADRISARPGRDPLVLVLASASPRRQDLLRAAGIAFTAQATNIAEDAQPGESARACAERLAQEKAAVLARPELVVLGADTIVVVDGEMLGKPADANDVKRMLRMLSGRSHEVI